MADTQNHSQNPPVSVRPAWRSYREYVQQHQAFIQQRNAQKQEPGGPRLWRQMVIGFILAACVGLILLLLGSIFISEAISSRHSISIMFCVMGIVCGLIILVGTGILGKLFISRKWRIAHGRPPSGQPPHVCMNTCSVVYTPSLDQLAQVAMDPPPPYESIMMTERRHSPATDSEGGIGSVEVMNSRDGMQMVHVQPIMILPPKYSDVGATPPPYGDPV